MSTKLNRVMIISITSIFAIISVILCISMFIVININFNVPVTINRVRPSTNETRNMVISTLPIIDTITPSSTVVEPTLTPTKVTPTTSVKNVTPNMVAPAPYVTPPLQFYISNISSGYKYCGGDAAGYVFGGIEVYTNQVTSQSFTWHIEMQDGTRTEDVASSMPNSQTWFSFPSTPDYPRMLADVRYPKDGDRIKLVITSPSRVSSNWSQVVPNGITAECDEDLLEYDRVLSHF